MFHSGGFTGTVIGSAKDKGRDGGSDTVAVAGETDRDVYTDTSDMTDDYTLTLTNTGGPTTTVTKTETDIGTVGGTDTETDAWGTGGAAGAGGLAESGGGMRAAAVAAGPGTDGGESGTETDAKTDDVKITVTVVNTATAAADGTQTPVSSKVILQGTDALGDTDRLTDKIPVTGGQETADDTTKTGGTDTFKVTVTIPVSGPETVATDENLDETLNLTGTLAEVGVAETTDDHVNLTGPVTGEVHKTAAGPVGGDLVSAPANGKSAVTLGGDFRVTSVVTGNPLGYGEVIWAALPNGQTADYDLTPDPAKVKTTTAVTDAGIKLSEDDTEAAGVWTVGSVDYADAPTVVITTVADYAGSGAVSHVAADVTGTGTYVITERGKTTDAGTPAALAGTRTAFHEDKRDAVLTWTGVGVTFDGSLDWHTDDWTRSDLDGTDAAGAVTVTDTKTTHAADSIARTFNYRTKSYKTAGAPDIAVRQRSTYDYNDHEVVTAGRDPAAGGRVAVTGVAGKGTSVSYFGATWSGPLGSVVTTSTSKKGWDHVRVDGSPEQVFTSGSAHESKVGRDPFTGQDWNYSGDGKDLPPDAPEPKDTFDAIASFAAGMGDAVSGGLTKRVRVALDYDDAVKAGGGYYGAGQVAGEAVNLALGGVNPCGLAAKARYAFKAVQAAQAAEGVFGAGGAFLAGDIGGGLGSLAGVFGNAVSLLKACFVAGTPIRTPGGAKPVESMRGHDEFGDECDWVMSRCENDPEGEVWPRRVMAAYQLLAEVWEVSVGGRVIGTTSEHLFWVLGKKWVVANELRTGDEFVGCDGVRTRVDGVARTGRYEAVYNFAVAEEPHVLRRRK